MSEEEINPPEFVHKGMKRYNRTDNPKLYDLEPLCQIYDGLLYGDDYPYVMCQLMPMWATCPRCREILDINKLYGYFRTEGIITP